MKIVREERTCLYCNNNDVEDEMHILIKYIYLYLVPLSRPASSYIIACNYLFIFMIYANYSCMLYYVNYVAFVFVWYSFFFGFLSLNVFFICPLWAKNWFNVEGSKYYGLGFQYTTNRGCDIPWVGVKIPCIGGSTYHG